MWWVHFCHKCLPLFLEHKDTWKQAYINIWDCVCSSKTLGEMLWGHTELPLIWNMSEALIIFTIPKNQPHRIYVWTVDIYVSMAGFEENNIYVYIWFYAFLSLGTLNEHWAFYIMKTSYQRSEDFWNLCYNECFERKTFPILMYLGRKYIIVKCAQNLKWGMNLNPKISQQ